MVHEEASISVCHEAHYTVALLQFNSTAVCFTLHTPPTALQPHNILLSDDGTPVVMDLGSACVAVKEVKTRQQALLLEEEATSKCSPAYRAPELTSVRGKKGNGRL